MVVRSGMVKKGFSLIELVIVLAIVTIIFSFSFFSVTSYNKKLSEVNSEVCMDSIFALINNSKQYCREKQITGYILFNISENTISFYCNGARVNKLYLSKDLHIDNTTLTQNKINIEKNGMAKNYGTIVLKNLKGDSQYIVLNIATGYAEIKN